MEGDPRRESRGWVFVINNYTEKEIELAKNIKCCQYVIFGKEIAPKTGTPHLQGFAYMKSETTRSSMQKKLGGRAWLHVQDGSGQDNQRYCGKDGVDVYESGKCPRQGARTDIEGMKAVIDGGGDMFDCFEANFALASRSTRGLEKYMSVRIRPRTTKPEVKWLWGPAGCGKTRSIYDQFELKDIYSKPHGWYDGYAGQKVFLIDDFDETTIPFKELLKLIDRYPFQGAVKGSFININSPVMYITCDKPPSEFWAAGNMLGQVLRRLEVVELKSAE